MVEALALGSNNISSSASSGCSAACFRILSKSAKWVDGVVSFKMEELDFSDEADAEDSEDADRDDERASLDFSEGTWLSLVGEDIGKVRPIFATLNKD